MERKLEVLVLDDNKEISEVMKIALSSPHCNVFYTDEAETAINYEADVYVLDFDLGAGRRTGDMVASIIRHNKPDAYIISHSGNPQHNPNEGLYNVKVSKPTGLMKIREIIRELEDSY